MALTHIDQKGSHKYATCKLRAVASEAQINFQTLCQMSQIILMSLNVKGTPYRLNNTVKASAECLDIWTGLTFDLSRSTRKSEGINIHTPDKYFGEMRESKGFRYQ